MPKRIKSLRSLHVALTGTCSRSRSVLTQQIIRRGGKVTGEQADVTRRTNLLVRGASPSWKHGLFGNKEALAANLIRSGSDLAVILAEDLDRLLEGRAVLEYPYVAGFDVEALRTDATVAGLPPAATRFPQRRPVDALTVSSRRLEQARLRQLHFGSSAVVACSLCGRRFPTSLMVAGHIKPRARCSAAQRRDLSNLAMPVCLAGCDTLFERGFVTVSSTGRVVTSRRFRRSSDLSSLLARLDGRQCPAHTEGTEPYFAWHRQYAFQTGAA